MYELVATVFTGRCACPLNLAALVQAKLLRRTLNKDVGKFYGAVGSGDEWEIKLSDRAIGRGRGRTGTEGWETARGPGPRGGTK